MSDSHTVLAIGDYASAVYDDTGDYRYRLTRVWSESLPVCAFVMLNPSTATEDKGDPTLRRCEGFARSWGFGAMEIVNLFALRSTDWRQLKAAQDPVGPLNDEVTAEVVESADEGYEQTPEGFGVIFAWGSHGDIGGRATQVRRALLGKGGMRARHLGINSDGEPRHPLYVPKGQPPTRFTPADYWGNGKEEPR